MKSLDGEVAIVTGASVGLGGAMALALTAAGARVALASPQTNMLDEVAGEIEKSPRANACARDHDRHHQARSVRRLRSAERGGIRPRKHPRQQCAARSARARLADYRKRFSILGV